MQGSLRQHCLHLLSPVSSPQERNEFCSRRLRGKIHPKSCSDTDVFGEVHFGSPRRPHGSRLSGLPLLILTSNALKCTYWFSWSFHLPYCPAEHKSRPAGPAAVPAGLLESGPPPQPPVGSDWAFSHCSWIGSSYIRMKKNRNVGASRNRDFALGRDLLQLSHRASSLASCDTSCSGRAEQATEEPTLSHPAPRLLHEVALCVHPDHLQACGRREFCKDNNTKLLEPVAVGSQLHLISAHATLHVLQVIRWPGPWSGLLSAAFSTSCSHTRAQSEFGSAVLRFLAPTVAPSAVYSCQPAEPRSYSRENSCASTWLLSVPSHLHISQVATIATATSSPPLQYGD